LIKILGSTSSVVALESNPPQQSSSTLARARLSQPAFALFFLRDQDATHARLAPPPPPLSFASNTQQQDKG
jgi:hypothetical protein